MNDTNNNSPLASVEALSNNRLGRRYALWLVAGAAAVCAIVASNNIVTGGLMVALIGIVATLAYRPTWSTWIFLFVTYINAPAVAVRFHGVPPIAAALVMLLLVVPIVYYVVFRGKPFYLDEVIPWLIAFTVIQLFGAALADHKLKAFSTLATFVLEGLLMYVLTMNAVRTKSVVWAIVAAGVFMGSLGLFQSVTGTYWRDFKGFALVSEPEINAYSEIVGGRWPAGPIGDKNYYAQFMLMLFPLSIGLAFSERTFRRRWCAVAAALIILVAVGLTGSRGAAVGFVAMVALMVAMRYISVGQATGVGIVAIILLMTMPAVRERMLSIVDVVHVLRSDDIRGADPAVKGRLTEMMAAVLVFAEHPIMGVGPGNFPSHFLEKADRLGFTVHAVERPAHSLYLEIAAETGMPGIICFTMILLLLVQKLYRATRLAPTAELRILAISFLAMFAVLLTTSMFLSLAYARYYFLVMGLSSAIARICIEDVGQTPTQLTPDDDNIAST